MPRLARLQRLGAVAVIVGARGRDRGAATRAGNGADCGVAEFSALPEGPVTVVFATFGYRHVVRAWMERAERAGVGHYRIVCLDGPLLRELREGCGERRAVSYRDLVPGAERVDIDALPDAAARMRVLTPLRMALFRRLAEAGHDFVHCDADAFWQRDLRPWLARQGGYDLLFSQGTTHPVAHFKAHHFTLCAGFFWPGRRRPPGRSSRRRRPRRNAPRTTRPGSGSRCSASAGAGGGSSARCSRCAGRRRAAPGPTTAGIAGSGRRSARGPGRCWVGCSRRRARRARRTGRCASPGCTRW